MCCGSVHATQATLADYEPLSQMLRRGRQQKTAQVFTPFFRVQPCAMSGARQSAKHARRAWPVAKISVL